MTADVAAQIIYNGIILTLVLSLPSVGAGLLVGFLISLFQAVTQIQEQTLTFVPKLVVILGMIAFTSPWMISLMLDFTITLWGGIPSLVR